MENKTKNADRFNGFLEGRGFYIILAVCLCVIGVSGYVLFFTEAEQPEYVLEIPKNNTAGSIATTKPLPDVTIQVEKDKPVAKTEIDIKETAKPKTPVVVDPIYLPPVVGKVSRGFTGGELVMDPTMGDYRTHNGVDIECPVGTSVTAMSDGKVEKVYADELLGNCVVLSHTDGIKSVYKGLSKGITLKVGGKIKAGDVIGASGDTNITEAEQAEHVHFEVTQEGKYVDPFSIIK